MNLKKYCFKGRSNFILKWIAKNNLSSSYYLEEILENKHTNGEVIDFIVQKSHDWCNSTLDVYKLAIAHPNTLSKTLIKIAANNGVQYTKTLPSEIRDYRSIAKKAYDDPRVDMRSLISVALEGDNSAGTNKWDCYSLITNIPYLPAEAIRALHNVSKSTKRNYINKDLLYQKNFPDDLIKDVNVKDLLYPKHPVLTRGSVEEQAIVDQLAGTFTGTLEELESLIKTI